MSKKVSMDDIARKLSVSKNTVSLVLRGMPGISDQTRKLIFDTAKQLGYSYKKKALSTGSKEVTSRNVCLILSKSTRDSIGFFSYIQLGIEDEAKKNNLNIIIYYYDESDENFEMPLSIKEGMISGIITLGIVSLKTLDSIIKFGLPLVVIDHYFDNIKTDCVLTDNQCGGYTAAEYLISCGHKEIGFVGNIDASISFYDRFQGYLKALKVANLPTDEPYTLINKSFEGLASSDLSMAVQELKSLPKLPTAIFCCNDAEAIVLLKTLSFMGISVPGDVSIIGFDDIESAKNTSPELTTIHVEKDLMGKKAVQRLLLKMEGKETNEEKILISTTLIQRQSVN